MLTDYICLNVIRHSKGDSSKNDQTEIMAFVSNPIEFFNRSDRGNSYDNLKDQVIKSKKSVYIWHIWYIIS